MHAASAATHATYRMQGYGRAQTKQDTLLEANESSGKARGDRQPQLQPLQAERREDEPLVCATPTRGMEASSSSGMDTISMYTKTPKREDDSEESTYVVT